MKLNFKSLYLYLGVLDIICFFRFIKFQSFISNSETLFLKLISLGPIVGLFIILATGVLFLFNKISLGRKIYFASIPFKVAYILPTIPFMGSLFPNQQYSIIFYAFIELARIGYTIYKKDLK